MKLGLSGDQASAIAPKVATPAIQQSTESISSDSPQQQSVNGGDSEAAAKIRAEYEQKLEEMQKKFEEEQGNKQRLGKISCKFIFIFNITIKLFFFFSKLDIVNWSSEH